MYPHLNLIIWQGAAYSFFTVAALLAVVGGGYFFAVRRGFGKSDVLAMLAGMSLAVFVGARLFNVVINYDWYQSDPGRIFALTASGFSLYGGILFGILAGLLISVRRKIPLMKFADTVTPFIGIGIALQRVGCFLNGCCFGHETDLPWGVKYPYLSHAHMHQIEGNLIGSMNVAAVHPTQIYELVAALIGTYIAFSIIKRGKVDGTAFLICGMYFSAFRWLNMQFRVLPYGESMTQVWYPLFYLAIIVACGMVLFWINRSASFKNQRRR